MAKINPIGLNIPDQQPPTGKPFFFNDKELTDWIEQLPIANVGETSKQIFKVLREFNRTQIPSKRRLQSVEHFHQPLSYIAANLSKHYVGSGFPLGDKPYRIAGLNRELHSGMATAYKSVITDLLMESQGKPDRKQLVEAIHRCMSYLSRVILLSVLVYDPYPKRIWRELHVLHRLAARYGIESTQVDDPIDKQGRTSSIDESYRRCILFSLASPYKMRQKDNLMVFDILLEWSHLAKIHSYDNAPEETTIIIHQNSDLAPGHETSVAAAESRYLLKMDASNLITQLREQFSDSQPETSRLQGISALNTGLVRQLIKLWSKAQKRAFVRTKLNFELRIAVGLRSIHKLISLGNEPEQPAEQQLEEGTWIESAFAEGQSHLTISPHFSLMPMESNSYNLTRGDYEEFGPNSRDFATLDESTPKIWDKEPKTLAQPATNTFKTINESAGGYCLDWSGEQIPKIHVGELIGVQSAMSANQFGVGIVRWMRQTANERLQVGVQMIAPNAMAVSAQEKTNNESESYDCLLLPEVGTSGQPTSFICPSYPFALGNQLQVNEGENLREIKLTRLLETSGAIAQFQFVYLDHQDLPDQEEESEEGFGDDTDFDNLWSTL
jgi:hypothetical protein